MTGLHWRKSSFSDNQGACVSMAELDDGTVLMRNSNRPELGTLTFNRADLAAFLAGAKAGEFDDLA